jgi:hypothetical protein
VPKGTVRCDDCIDLLVTSPATQVRLALVSEEHPDPSVIAALASDGDLMVAGTARFQQGAALAHTDGVSHPPVPSSRGAAHWDEVTAPVPADRLAPADPQPSEPPKAADPWDEW